jgi:hypothetical protein
MKFPVQCCVELVGVSLPMLMRLIRKMESDGYIMPSFQRHSGEAYIGVNPYGDIMYYSHPDSYISMSCWAKKGDNVLSKTWLLNYLGEN